MAISHVTTPTAKSERALATLNTIAGRASGARAVLSSALDLVDASRATGEIKASNEARERLSRLLLEAASKAIDFQRAIEALKNAQA